MFAFLRGPSATVSEVRRPRAVPCLRVLALAALALLPSTGCSLFLTKGPPPKAERAAGFTCTDSPVLPVVDIGLSVLSLAETIHAAAKERTPWPWVGASLVFGVSGGLGAGRANACNAARGHPYRPHPPAVQGGMMPEEPFGLRSAHPARPPSADDEEAPDGDEPDDADAAPAKTKGGGKAPEKAQPAADPKP